MKITRFFFLFLVFLNCSDASKKLLPLFGLGSGEGTEGGGISTSVSESATLKKITIEPPRAEIVTDSHAEYTATAVYSDGTKIDVSSQVDWSTQDESFAKKDISVGKSQKNSSSKSFKKEESDSDTTTKKGIFKGVNSGSTKVKATLNGVIGEGELVVKAATIVKLEITQLDYIATNSTVNFRVVAILSDGTKQDITKSVSWGLSKESGGSLGLEGDNAGTFTALEDGNLEIIASFAGFTTKTQTNISKTRIQTLSIEGKESLVKGLNTTLRVTALYEDGSSADVTEQANWLSEDRQIVTVNNDSTKGKIIGIEPGESIVRASLQGKQVSKKVTITAPKVVSVSLVESAEVAAGFSYNYRAFAEFDDNITREVTQEATWEVNDDSIGFVYNQKDAGKFQALKQGTTNVTATVNSITATSRFTVKPAILQKISIGSSINLPKGIGTTLNAYGIFSDGSKRDISREKDLIWNTKGESARVKNDLEYPGQVLADKVGVTIVSAELNRVVSDSIQINVSPAILQSISIEPSNFSIPRGKEQSVKAIGFYSDNTSKDITDSVFWSLDSNSDGSSDVSLGSVSNSVSPGKISTSLEKEGKGKIIASIKSDTGVIRAESPFEVTKAVLESISVSSVETPKGVAASIRVTGTFSDNTTRDLTGEAGYKVTGGLTVDSNGKIDTGIESLQPGLYTVTTTIDKLSVDSTFTIKPAILTSISLGPEIKIAKGLETTFHAIGIYSDMTKKDISSDVTWSGDLSISNDPNSTGKVLGSAQGTYKISATYKGISGSASLIVSPAVLESITIEPTISSLPKGTSQPFRVFGKYTDGKREITGDVSWILDSDGDLLNDEILGGISNGNTPGLFQSSSLASTGKGKVIAKIDNLSASAVLEVRPAELVSLSLSPVTVPKGVPAKLVAIGTFTDGTKKDVTREVSFISGDSSVWINQLTGEIDTTNLLGEYSVTANLSGKSAKSNVIISEAVLVSIALDAPAEIAKGLSANLRATGLYSDGTTKDLTKLATFISDRSDYISNLDGSNGNFFAKAIDEIKVRVAYSGITSQTSSIKVIPATLIGLTIDQPKVSIPKGTSQKFTVTGTFTDGKRDLSSQVLWELELGTLGTIANGDQSGVFTSGQSSSTGSSRIVANFGGTKAYAELEIRQAELVSISLGSSQSLALGLDLPGKAIGTYTDGTTKDISSMVQWSITGGLFISPTGVVSGTQTGNFTITASIGNITTNIPLQIKEAELVALTVSPGLSNLAKGTSLQLKAVGVYTDGTSRDHTKDVYWSSDPTKIRVENQNNKGVATAASIGISTVSASFLGKQANAVLTVTPAELVSISLGNPQSTADGLTSKFTAIGTYTDNSTSDISSMVSWSLVGKGSITNGLLNGGIVSTSGEGSTTIIASLNGITGTTSLMVTPAEITSIVISQPNLSVAKGISSVVNVTGNLTNGKTVDLSSNVTWKADSNGDGIDDQNVVSVSNLAENRGTITTNGIGTATVTATVNGKSSSINVTVSKAELVSISVSPANPSVAKGLTQQFRAVGFYTDNTSQDITQTVSWIAGDSTSGESGFAFSPVPSALSGNNSSSLSISSSGVASISNADGSRGLLAALNPGSVTIFATKDNKTGSVTTTIGQAVLTGISITSSNTSRPKGLTEQFKATGVYSDGSTQDLTSQINWKADSNGDGIDDSVVVSVSNQTGSKGLVTANGIGTVVVTGSINGITSTKTFTISPAAIISVEFQNSNEIPTPTGSVAAGLTDTIKAIATYTDNTIQDVTSNISWIADSNGDGKNDNLVAVVDSNGIVRTIAPGTVQIIGSINGVTTTKTITVLQPSLMSLEVTPSSGSIAEGYTQQFTATGTFTDGSKQDLTLVASWKSDSNGDNLDDSLVASISNLVPGRGTALGIKAGSSTITASYNNQSSKSTLSITPGVTKTQTVGSYDLTLPSGLSTTTNPGGSFSGIVYTGGSGLTGFVSTIPDYGANSPDTLGTTVVGKILNDSPDKISNTSIISSNTVNINNGGTVVYDMTITTNTPMKPTDVSNHLIQEIGTNTINGNVTNLPLPQGSETTSTDFRAIVQVTYNQYGSEMVGVGVTTSTTFANNQAIISNFLNGSNLIVSGTTLVDKTDSFIGTEDPMVDFIWVVDNSGSMTEEQSSVINNSITFFNKLNGKHLDFRLGVLATGNAGTSKAWELWGTSQDNTRWVRKSDTNAATRFQSNVKVVGLGGSGLESGIYYAERSIGGAPTGGVPAAVNATVVPRPGAKLVFVILSDEGDHYQCYSGGSFKGDGYTLTVNGVTITQPCDGGVTFDPNNNLFKTRGHRVYSIIGLNAATGQPGTCAASPTSAGTVNNRNPAYFNLAKATGGSSSSICNTDYSPILENISTQSAAASSSYTLSRKPISSSIIVKVGGVTITQDANNGWMYNSSSNSIVFSGSAWPDPGAKIEVSYKYDSSVTFGEVLEKFIAYLQTELSHFGI